MNPRFTFLDLIFSKKTMPREKTGFFERDKQALNFLVAEFVHHFPTYLWHVSELIGTLKFM